MPESNGNGASKVVIQSHEFSPGFVYFEAGRPAPGPAELPHFLGRAVGDWLRDHPGHEVRATLGMVCNGNTCGIYLWCDPPEEEDEDEEDHDDEDRA